MWERAARFVGVPIGGSFENVATKWLDHKKFGVVNIISTNVLRAIWLMRNEFVFNNQVWRDSKATIWWSLKLMKMWAPMYAEQGTSKLEEWVKFLEKEISMPLAIQSA